MRLRCRYCAWVVALGPPDAWVACPHCGARFTWRPTVAGVRMIDALDRLLAPPGRMGGTNGR